MMHQKAGPPVRSLRSRRAATRSARPNRRLPSHGPPAMGGTKPPVGSPEWGYSNGFDLGFKLGLADGYEVGLAENNLNF